MMNWILWFLVSKWALVPLGLALWFFRAWVAAPWATFVAYSKTGKRECLTVKHVNPWPPFSKYEAVYVRAADGSSWSRESTGESFPAAIHDLYGAKPHRRFTLLDGMAIVQRFRAEELEELQKPSST